MKQDELHERRKATGLTISEFAEVCAGVFGTNKQSARVMLSRYERKEQPVPITIGRAALLEQALKLAEK